MADVEDRANDAIHEGEDGVKQGAEVVAEKAGEVMSGVRGYAGHVAEQSRRGYRQVAEETREGIRQAGAVVRGNLGPSVATAFGIGIAVGVIVGLSLRSRRT